MEDDDTDAEMPVVDYGTDFSDDVDPNCTLGSLLQLMLGRHSGMGNRIPRLSVFWGLPDSRFPLEWPGIGNRETGRFPIGREPGIGVPIRRAGDFLVCRRRRQTRNGHSSLIDFATTRALFNICGLFCRPGPV
jgi:hypothetical protein